MEGLKQRIYELLLTDSYPIFKAVCHYLMEKDYDQFAHLGYLLASGIAVEGYTHNYSWYLYVDNHQHLQMSIVRPSVNHVRISLT